MTDKEKIKDWVKNLKSQAGTIPNLGINSLAGFQLACDDVIAFIDSLPEEHNEDLEEEIDRYYSDWQFDDDTIYEDMRDICRHFAEWQKKRDQETIELAEDHAMLAGMNKMKEEMMKDAVDAFVHQGLYSKYVKECDDGALANVLKNHNSGDKVKIIIVKTEQ